VRADTGAVTSRLRPTAEARAAVHLRVVDMVDSFLGGSE
jgi:hypothetical protein